MPGDDARKVVFLVFAGLFGLLLGSFLNVCIFRLPRQCMSVWRQTRSRCPRCRAFIAWYDNLPVVSWLALGGKCRACRNPISGRYVLVELLTGAGVGWLAWAQLWPGGAAAELQGYPAGLDDVQRAILWAAQVYLCAAMLVSTFIDFEFKILPDEINYPGLGIGIAACAIFPFLHLGAPLTVGWPLASEPFELRARLGEHTAMAVTSLVGAGVGAALTFLVRTGGELAFKREAMGWGDVKLMAFMGAWLGWRGALLMFFLGCFFGAIYGLVQWPFTRRLTRVEVWFGPFLGLAALLLILASRLVDRAMDGALDLMKGLAEQGPGVMAGLIAVCVLLLVAILWNARRRGRDEE